MRRIHGPVPIAPLQVAVVVATLAVAALAPACAGPSAAPTARSGGTVTEGAASPASTSATAPSDMPVATAGPPTRPGAPGALIDAVPIPAGDVPGALAWRITYHSRDAGDRDIAVTGLVLAPGATATDAMPTASGSPPAPADPAAVPGTGRPVVTYGHPTTGSADACAPSAKGTASLPFPARFVERGWVLVMTDYEGLGTSDPHPYLVGASEGHAMLDAVRAARQIEGAGVSASSPVDIAGFSQGGHAAAFAGELAPAYAPDLDVRGVALAAPVSDVAHFAGRAEGMADQLGVLATITAGFAHAYPELSPSTVFTDGAVALLPLLEERCIGEINQAFDRPIRDMVRARATAQASFRDRFAQNQAGTRSLPVPALIVQGGRDDIISPADSHALAERWCRLGVPVDEVLLPERNHGVMVEQPFLDWLAARFERQAPGSGCRPSPG